MASGLRANPDVSINPDGTWWMYYNGPGLTSDNKGNFNTCRMYSADGINWKESSNNPIQQYDTMATCTPHVVWRSDTEYELWYGYGSPTFLDFSVYRQFLHNDPEIIETVYASSEALEVMNAIKAVDNERLTFWSSTGHVGSGLHTEWIYFDLGEPIPVSQVNVLPRIVSGNPMCFPLNFKLQFGEDGENWTDIEGQSYSDYHCTDTSEQKFFFDSTIETRFIRLYATKLSADSYGNYYCQIAEINTANLPTGVTDEKSAKGLRHHNSPNPFHTNTIISYSLNSGANVSLKVFDMAGKEMVTLVHAWQSAGSYQPEWNGTNSSGRLVPYGMYIYRLSAGGENVSGKMLFTE
jgi:hypothetical protein